jgi:hypothetical protein
LIKGENMGPETLQSLQEEAIEEVLSAYPEKAAKKPSETFRR